MDELLRILKTRRTADSERYSKRASSVEAWRDYWNNKNHRTAISGIDGKLYSAYNWIDGREIRMFCMPGVDERVIPYVEAGIQDMVQQIGLDFSMNYYGSHVSAVEQVKQSARKDGTIDGHKLLKILIAETWRNPSYGGRPHADVMIIDRFLASGDENWGQSEFSEGYMILALPNTRQRSFEFIRNISKHETGHLFGLGEHHDTTNVDGYRHVPKCNMLWEVPIDYTCDKCADAITYFWRGIETRTGEKFFR